jgi:hypothetical protein
MTTSDNFWEDPSNPFFNALDEDRGDKERNPEVGAWVWHLDHHEIEALHEQVHDNIVDWVKTRIVELDVDIRDEVRMASHCLAHSFAEGLCATVAENGQLDQEQLYNFARVCVQMGYAMRQEEDDGQLSL